MPKIDSPAPPGRGIEAAASPGLARPGKTAGRSLPRLAGGRSLPFPRWAKVLRDLWSHKTRSLLVVLSIAVGVFALGVIAGTQHLLNSQFTSTYLASNPAHARLDVRALPATASATGLTGFDEDLMASVARLPPVKDVSARFGLSLSVRSLDGKPQDLVLYLRPDFGDTRVNALRPEEGLPDPQAARDSGEVTTTSPAWWPPLEDTIVLERNSLALLDAGIGDPVEVELPDGRRRTVTIAGTVHDINLPPARFAGRLFGYVGDETLEKWGYPRQFSELLITVGDTPPEYACDSLASANACRQAYIESVTEIVQDKVESGGYSVGAIRVPEPGEAPVQDILDSLFLILGILGFLALALSGFLVVNTIAAILAQQVRQVGVMKAVGARTSQIMGLYFGTAVIFGVLALIIALPLGAWGAYELAQFAAGFLNFDVALSGTGPQVLAMQAGVAVLLPLAASAIPILSGTRITVREAISSYGLGKGRFGHGPADRLLVGALRSFPFLSRPLLLSLRNTFRRKARLALTMVTLTLGGAIFVAVLSVRLSLNNTQALAARYEDYDVGIAFDRSYRLEQIEQVALEVPGVTAVEAWGYANAVRERPDGSLSERIRVQAPSATTAMIQPILLEGRWLLPEDESAVVLNSTVLDEEPDLQVGDPVTLEIGGKETRWTVVGIVQSLLVDPTAYVNYPHFSRLTGTYGRANFARISVNPDDPEAQQQAAAALEAQFEVAGYQVDSTNTTADDQEDVAYQFGLLVTFLVIMALLIAAVGGMGLMGTMSINVLERTREIGVLRAVGASDGALMQIILVEGLLIGLVSWLQAAVLAWPVGRLMSDQIGRTFVDAPLEYGYSMGGLGLWLVIALVIAALASYLPARNAARLTVREVLSYE